MKRAPVPKTMATGLGSYAITPFGHEAGPRLDGRGEDLLRSWVDPNRTVLQDYWDAEIPFTQDAIEQLKPV